MPYTVSMDLSELKNRAAFGDADALYKLGRFYMSGPVVERNEEEAFQCFQAAVQLGNAEAINGLGVCFLHGYGTEKNESQAIALFREASDKGIAKGTYNIGNCYLRGWGVEADHEKGIKLILESENSENPNEDTSTLDASFGELYFYGFPRFKIDYKKAAFYLQRAAEKENPQGMALFGYCLLYGLGVQPDPVRASEYFQKALPYGIPLAETGWGLCLFHGCGTKKNLKKAFAQFQKAAQEGDTLGGYYSAWCLLNGTGTRKNAKQAVKLLEQSVKINPYHEAMYLLGWCYQNGLGTRKNRSEAAWLFKEAAGEGNASAAFEWAECLFRGYGVEKDRQEAEKWYQYAVEQGTAWTPEKESQLRWGSYAMFCLQWFIVPLILLLSIMVAAGDAAVKHTINDFLILAVLSILFLIGPVSFVLGLCGYLKPAKWGAVFMGGASVYAFAWLVWAFGLSLFGFVVVSLLYGRVCYLGLQVSHLMGQKAYWLERQRNGRIISFRTPIVVCLLVFVVHGIHLAWKFFFNL